jgi:RNA polymerase sigma factor (sigma-70 family)
MIQDEVVHVGHEAAGMPAVAPSELSAVLLARTETARDDAWAGFVRAYTDRILRIVRFMGGEHDTVMDRYAFVLDHLREDECRRLRAYAGPGSGPFELWLVVVVRRLCLDHHRVRYGRSRERSGRDQSRDERAARRRLVDLVADHVDTALLAAPSHGAPDQVLARSERGRALSQAVEGLPPRDRLLLRLRFAEDLPAREIARLMSFPTLFHVYRRLDKVLGGLRETLQFLGVQDAEP